MAQFFFTYSDDAQCTALATTLIAMGYTDINALAEHKPTFHHVPCVCVDTEKGIFFPINAACAAAISQSRGQNAFHPFDEAEIIAPKFVRKKKKEA